MVSKKSLEIPPFIVMDVLERAAELTRAGRSIIHLEVGEPDFDTPACIKEAAIKAVRDGKTQYTHSLGLIELREALAEHYQLKYGVKFSPEQVIITEGTSPGFLLLLAALLDKGDQVVISNPHYACYPNFVRFLDGEPVFVNIDEEDGFQYRPEAIEAVLTPRTAGLIINSPANPTGILISAERMRRLAEFSPYIISDEIYHGLVYEGQEHSMLEFTDRALVLNGFSKLYAMTGWRLGYIIVPPDFVRPIQKMQQNFFISAANFIQWAGIAALKEAGAEVSGMVKVYDERRCYMIRRLKELGFGIKTEPTGAFYVLANAKHLAADSYRLAFRILEEAGVGVTPGIDFGSHAEGYLRFSYANSLANIKEGMSRLEAFLAQVYPGRTAACINSP